MPAPLTRLSLLLSVIRLRTAAGAAALPVFTAVVLCCGTEYEQRQYSMVLTASVRMRARRRQQEVPEDPPIAMHADNTPWVEEEGDEEDEQAL